MKLTACELRIARGGRLVLDGIDLSLRRGTVVAIVGPNGVGKSTLLAALAGLIAPANGSVQIDSTDLRSLPAAIRAQRFAFLPQHPETVWPVSVSTLVGLARIPFRALSSARRDEAAVAGALERTGTLQWADRDVQTLSGGERARVMLARLIAGEPQWILADEPFAGLDPAHQFDAASLLRSLAEAGCGVVFTVHDLTLAASLADRVIVLSNGKIVADGAPDSTLTPGLLREVYEVDAQWACVGGGRFIAIKGRHAS
jgi:iron complex transport system ATP-binding protein